MLAYKAQWARQVQKLKNEARKLTVQFEEASEGFVCEEEGQMEQPKV